MVPVTGTDICWISLGTKLVSIKHAAYFKAACLHSAHLGTWRTVFKSTQLKILECNLLRRVSNNHYYLVPWSQRSLKFVRASLQTFKKRNSLPGHHSLTWSHPWHVYLNLFFYLASQWPPDTTTFVLTLTNIDFASISGTIHLCA